MSKALSQDLRDRFSRLMSEGHRASEAGRILRLSRATSARWGKRWREYASLVPKYRGREKGSGKLAPYQSFFEELICQDPGITLFELRDALEAAEGVNCHHSSIHAFLIRLGFSYKSHWSRARDIKQE